MKEKIAKYLFTCKCIQFSPQKPFTYASGLLGPIYCDNRVILSHPKERREIVRAFIQTLTDMNVAFEHLAPLATAGIPHGSFIAHEMQKSLIYIRGKKKEHGRGNQIEGDYNKGDRIIIIEDLVNQAKSLIEGVQAASAHGLEVVAVLCIVDYEMKQAKKLIIENKLRFKSLTDFTTLLDIGFKQNLLDQKEVESLKRWQLDPNSWTAN